MKRLIVTGAMMLGLSILSQAQNTGNTTLGSGLSWSSGLQNYTRDQIIAEVGKYYGQQVASEIAAATHPDTGYIMMTDVLGKPGESDSDTIGINTNWPLFICAVACAHEYAHTQNCGSGPNANDPVTNDPVCGACAHAEMHSDDADSMEAMCEGISESEIADLCDAWDGNLAEMQDLLTSCQSSGCTECCGSSGSIPSASDLQPDPPPCCE
jgi:hypothetical protein